MARPNQIVADRGPVRLLFLIPGLDTGGTERLVLDCATRFAPHHVTTAVASFLDGPLRSELTARRVPVHVLWPDTGDRPLTRVHRLSVVRTRLRGLARQADIVHSHHLPMLLHGALARLPRQGWRWIHTEHTPLDRELSYPHWLVRLSQHLLRLPDAITTVSPAVTESIVSLAPASAPRCHTILNGIDLTRFPATIDPATKRQELGLPSDAWVVGSVGTLRPQKNQQLLIRAFAEVLREIPNAWLILTGTGETRAGLEHLASDLGVADRIRFLGSRLDVPDLMRSFDVYCLPSRYEGMPLTVFEAMAARLPVVATAVTGIREVVDPEKTGLLVPPDDPPALVKALVRLHNDPRLASCLAAAGEQHARRVGGITRMLQEYHDLYERVLYHPSDHGGQGAGHVGRR